MSVALYCSQPKENQFSCRRLKHANLLVNVSVHVRETDQRRPGDLANKRSWLENLGGDTDLVLPIVPQGSGLTKLSTN